MAYWALKTRASDENRTKFEEKWDKFVSECVIAIGWEKIDVSPDKVDDNELKKAVRNAYHCSDRAAGIAARTIRKFVGLNENDKILICRGYTPNEGDSKMVHIYGTAQKIGSFYDDRDSKWWRFKHGAKIEEFRKDRTLIPKRILVKMLKRGSLLLTLQEITKEGFESVVKWVRR